MTKETIKEALIDLLKYDDIEQSINHIQLLLDEYLDDELKDLFNKVKMHRLDYEEYGTEMEYSNGLRDAEQIIKDYK